MVSRRSTTANNYAKSLTRFFGECFSLLLLTPRRSMPPHWASTFKPTECSCSRAGVHTRRSLHLPVSGPSRPALRVDLAPVPATAGAVGRSALLTPQKDRTESPTGWSDHLVFPRTLMIG